MRQSTEAPPDSRIVRAKYARAARAYANLSQAEIAEVLDVSPVTVKRIEAGRRDLSPEELQAIANRCGVPLSFLKDGFDGVANDVGFTLKHARELHEHVERRFDQLVSTLERTSVGQRALFENALAALTEPSNGNGESVAEEEASA